MSENVRDPENHKLSRRPRGILLGSTMLSLLILSSCGLLPEEAVYERAPIVPAYTQSPYEYTEVVRGDIEIVELLRFEYAPTQEVNASFSVGGLLFDGIYAKQGSQVQEGELLAELESGDIERQISDARYEAERLDMALRQMEERFKLLDEPDTDNSQADAKRALENQIYLQKLSLEQMEEQRNERQIRAPFDATVAYAREKRTGDRSVADETMFRLVVSESSMFVGRTKIPQYFTVGTKWLLLVGEDEIPVVTVDPSDPNDANETTDTDEEVEVYLRIDAEHIVMETGTKAQLHVLLDSSEDTLLLDAKALHYAEEQAFVYVESADGLREVKYVEIGLVNRSEVEVLSGLEEGERVILE